MRPLVPLICAGALVCAGCGGSNMAPSSTPTSTAAPAGATTNTSLAPQARAGQLGPEGVPLESGPLLAPASTTSPTRMADGVQCAPTEQVAYHIHAHLQVYVGGAPRTVPGGIGMLGVITQQTRYGSFYGAVECYYWLHTHAGDGILHIESPTQTIYTLANFFAVWDQPLSSTQVASASGPVTAFVDGKRWTKDPSSIPLLPHAEIQLDVGTPVVPFHGMSWAGLGL